MKTSAKIPEFEGLRGLLAGWVVMSHLLLLAGLSREWLPAPLRLLLRGDIAVDVFMILSGFVIYLALDRRRDSYGQFLVRRFFRLYPVYLCCLAAMIPLIAPCVALLAKLPWADDPSLQWIIRDAANTDANRGLHLLLHLTLLHGLLPSEMLPGSQTAFLGPAWSISLEWQFYLVAPAAFFLIRRDVRWLSVFGAAAIFCAWEAPQFGGPFTLGKYFTYELPGFLPLKAIYFLAGACSFRGYRWILARPKNDRVAQSLIVGLFFVGLLRPPIAGSIWCAVLGVHLVRMRSRKNLLTTTIGSVLTSRVSQWLGRISYCMYLSHLPILYVALAVMLWLKPAWERWPFFIGLTLLALPTLLLVSHFLSQTVEQPFIRAARQWTKRASEANELASRSPG